MYVRYDKRINGENKIISLNFSPVCGVVVGVVGGLVLERRWWVGRWRGLWGRVGKGRERGGGEAARYGSRAGRLRNRWRGWVRLGIIILLCYLLLLKLGGYRTVVVYPGIICKSYLM